MGEDGQRQLLRCQPSRSSGLSALLCAKSRMRSGGDGDLAGGCSVIIAVPALERGLPFARIQQEAGALNVQSTRATQARADLAIEAPVRAESIAEPPPAGRRTGRAIGLGHRVRTGVERERPHRSRGSAAVHEPGLTATVGRMPPQQIGPAVPIQIGHLTYGPTRIGPTVDRQRLGRVVQPHLVEAGAAGSTPSPCGENRDFKRPFSPRGTVLLAALSAVKMHFAGRSRYAGDLHQLSAR